MGLLGVGPDGALLALHRRRATFLLVRQVASRSIIPVRYNSPRRIAMLLFHDFYPSTKDWSWSETRTHACKPLHRNCGLDAQMERAHVAGSGFIYCNSTSCLQGGIQFRVRIKRQEDAASVQAGGWYKTYNHQEKSREEDVKGPTVGVHRVRR